MASTWLSLHVHLVFATKNRRPLIVPALQDGLHRHLGGVVTGLGAVADTTGGVADHVHMLIGLRATHCLADLVREVKKASSVWAAARPAGQGFGRQEGYAAFTVGATGLPALRHCIAGQAGHHRTVSFRDEFVRLLDEAGVAWDERFLMWQFDLTARRCDPSGVGSSSGGRNPRVFDPGLPSATPSGSARTPWVASVDRPHPIPRHGVGEPVLCRGEAQPVPVASLRQVLPPPSGVGLPDGTARRPPSHP